METGAPSFASARPRAWRPGGRRRSAATAESR